MTDIQRLAIGLQRRRDAAALAEANLKLCIDVTLGAERGAGLALATQLGVSPSYLSDVRHGKRGIGDEFLRKLCEVE